MELTHFLSHYGYQLTLNDKTEDLQTPATCKACEEVCVGPTYICNGFPEFLLHKSCAELPIEFPSPYHRHPLTLNIADPECDGGEIACDLDLVPLTVHCKQCDQYLDLQCALPKNTIDEGRYNLLYCSHFHPLTFKKNHAANCSVCGEFGHGAFYSCEPCKFYLHQSCSYPLQKKLQDFKDMRNCPRDRAIYGHAYCGVCGDEITSNYYYNCASWRTCRFTVDIRCALLLSKMGSEGLKLFHHFSHSHPLTLGNTNADDEINCAICHSRCSGQTYICSSSKCKSFSLHQSCFDLPEVIYHQIHAHPLFLEKCNGRGCYVCSVPCVGFVYRCHHCLIELGVDCLTKISVIKYQGHEHDLLFSPNWNRSNSLCGSCGTEPQMSSPMHSPLFICVKCDFFLHLKCGPLPCAIAHEDHNLHLLTLTDSPVVAENEDRDGTRTDQFVCDACQKVDRDPRLPVYYCHEGCRYLAEFECVIPEVIRSLMGGQYEEVELKTPIRHVGGMVIASSIVKAITDLTKAREYDHINPRLTFRYILNSSMVGERDEFRSVIEASENDIHQDSSEAYSLIIHAAKTRFKELRNLLYHADQTEPWRREKVVSVGDHLVPMSLAPFLEDLCAKYGDIGAESTLRSSKLKTYFLVMLCATIKSMYATRVVDISEHFLANWWVNLKIMQFAGFKVQFAFDRLNSVMHAYNGIDIEYEEKKKREKLRCEIEEASQAIEQLKAELVTKTNMLESLESEPEFSGFKGYCLREASALRWKVAGEGLL